jgi:uncharacterized membrane protein YdbT with pleckstrin-like domain
VSSVPPAALRRLRGPYEQTRREFYGSGDAFLLLLLIVVTSAAIACVMLIAEFNWYLMVLLVAVAIAAAVLVPRAGTAIECDGEVIVVRSRFGRVRSTVRIADITEARVAVHQAGSDSSSFLEIVAGDRRLYVPICRALQDELPPA